MTALLDRVVARALGVPRRDTHVGHVHLEQRGTMRLKEGGRWLPFTATQRIDARRCGFRWDARVKMAPFLTLRVVDEYTRGKGSLDASVFGFLRLAHAEGPECDLGEVLRYLAELPWCPPAYVQGDALRFEDLAADRLRVTCDRGPAGGVELHVDEDGDVVGVSTDGRPRAEGKQMVLRPWSAVFRDHQEVAGVRIPRRGAVTWHLPSGPFETWRGEITSYRLDHGT